MDNPLRNFGVTMVQLQSFFNAVFRYTCLFHNKFLLKYNISAFVSYEIKKLRLVLPGSFNYFQKAAKLTITLNILLPLISVGIASTQHSPGLSICLGEDYKNFFSSQLKMCNYNNPIGNNACKLFFVLQLILMSNLIDIYCVYFISKKINSQTEVAKSIIGENAYISRKKYVDHTFFFTFCSIQTNSLEWLLYLGSLDWDYCKVVSSRPVYYSIFNSLGIRSQYICIKFPLHKQSKNAWVRY